MMSTLRFSAIGEYLEKRISEKRDRLGEAYNRKDAYLCMCLEESIFELENLWEVFHSKGWLYEITPNPQKVKGG